MRLPQQIKPRSGDRGGSLTLRLTRGCRQRVQKILSPLRGLTAGCQRWSVGLRSTATTCRRSTADAQALSTRAEGPIDNSLGQRPRKISQLKSPRANGPPHHDHAGRGFAARRVAGRCASPHFSRRPSLHIATRVNTMSRIDPGLRDRFSSSLRRTPHDCMQTPLALPANGYNSPCLSPKCPCTLIQTKLRDSVLCPVDHLTALRDQPLP